ncbi:protein phosphatase 1 regulatory subunit 12B [Austrofundulus limnaeus]|uniref:Protein phosphatase 1 regulatory subunit 12B n=1 Tax=Austrofundulus limnaeus TaxID=52670 RepID=A0A2I4BF03_AUSLI|nr:PREDICTED: protein phosphatase 1 regulatory subunit 12B-like [Austrofundulus limnaeus]
MYLTPIKDEDAESERKAKSRHARQTRRSTQGVTLTDLREAQRTYSLAHQDREKEEGGAVGDRPCQTRGFADDSEAEDDLTGSTGTAGISLKWSKEDEEGNIESRLDTFTRSPDLSYLSLSESCDLLRQNFFKAGEKWWRDENQNLVEDAAQLNSSTTTDLKPLCCEAEDTQHERLSRYDSTGESAAEKALGRTSSYTRRETRLAALNRQEQESTAKDYKKMYTEALQENERLKSRLQDSKQELVKIRSQLEKVTQRQDRMSERSAVLESEKREKQVLEKKVSNMEEEIKVLTELKSDNQRLKDENGALIRVISKLSK